MAVKNTIRSEKKSEDAPKTKGKAKSKAKAKGKSKSKKGFKMPELPSWLTDERTRKIIGVFFSVLAIFLLLSGISFLITGQHDLRLIENSPSIDEDGTVETFKNMLGKVGAYSAYLMMHRGFGIGGLFIPFLLFLYGIRIWLQKALLPLAKTTRLSIVGMLLIPLIIGFLFHTKDEVAQQIIITCNDNFVGVYGVFATRWAIFTLGWFGTLLFLLFVVGAMVIFNFDPKIEGFAMPAWVGKIRTMFSSDGFDEEVLKEESKGESEEESTEETSSGGNRLKSEEKEELEEVPFDPDPAGDVLDELVGDITSEVSLTPEPEVIPTPEPETTSSELEVEVPVAETPENDTPGDDDELEIEVRKEEEELTEDQIDSKLQEFGAYDPKLDLSHYELPNIDLLEPHGSGAVQINKEELEANKNRIVETLNNYKIEISKIKATVGPTVTLYEIVPAPGVRISKIKNLEDDIALSLAALGIRIIAPIPGKGTIGIEVPNSKPSIVSMRSLIASDKYQNADMELPIAIGKTISNETFTFDLAKMPHLLMAGATGQGKSVGLNAMLVSLLYKKHPSQLKFVLVDPKKVELTLFNKIERHFLAKLPDEEEPIITDTSKVVQTLNSLCVEMDQRYELLKTAHCRNIKEYNKKFVARKLNPENGHRYLPYIVLVVDEFADLIMTAGKEVETPIARLAQLARAIGIHLIIATQRPSVNIITGTIKANFPARIAFRVTSKIDSRTILDAGGADQLIGRGDMLFSTGSDLTRIQCGFVDTPEVEEITDYIGAQQGYPDAFLLPEYVDENASEIGSLAAEDRDVLFEDAARVIVMHQQGSTSLLQRKLKLGYNRAGRLIDQLEAAGIIGPFKGSKAREVLIPDEMSLEQLLNNEQ
ncbi:FtsK/SpoIIIE family DNA translocase [Sanyastnella coralliicola]|uniref:FtsK/SpoIIIE family DNA translocase n=1 Tax=Sanyastnella coralliicola TaxID=3069118 RepID=UPI0027B9A685|nr:DNA translocase FtsK [Longitalea sp. SCSIO 12813]